VSVLVSGHGLPRIETTFNDECDARKIAVNERNHADIEAFVREELVKLPLDLPTNNPNLLEEVTGKVARLANGL
jgi:hypothetical protein